MRTTHLPISPSKTLVRFADQIASFLKAQFLMLHADLDAMLSRWRCEAARPLGQSVQRRSAPSNLFRSYVVRLRWNDSSHASPWIWVIASQWHSLRQPLLKEAEQLIKKFLRVSDHDARELAERVHLIVDLDYAADCNRGEASWVYTDDLVRLAHEVEERFVRLESYVSSPLYANRTQFFSNLPG